MANTAFSGLFYFKINPFAFLEDLLASLKKSLSSVVRCRACQQKNRVDMAKMIGKAKYAHCRKCGEVLGVLKENKDGSMTLTCKGLG